MKTSIPFFKDRKALFAYLIENKLELETKKLQTEKDSICHKLADVCPFNQLLYPADREIEEDKVIKAGAVDPSQTSIKVKAAINTTNLHDSHDDVHLPGIWHKSLKESGKSILHLQEHQAGLKTVISSKKDLKAYTEMIEWAELGFPQFKGETQALMFESNVRKSRNPYMFEQYAEGYIDNHSVGMQYVKMFLAVNDPQYKEEFSNWEKYFPEVANKDYSESRGFFWAVKEAKAREGSAVLMGSNWATPTLDNNMKESEPGNHSGKREPGNHSQIDYSYLMQNL